MTQLIQKLNSEAITEAISARLPWNTIEMVHIHVEKPWIQDYATLALAPLRKGLDPYFKSELLWHADRKWYFPSLRWWKAHARSSHPPDGSGCDMAVHTAFLTPQGRSSEFLYAAVLRDGSVRVLGKQDFADECWWWRKNFKTS